MRLEQVIKAMKKKGHVVFERDDKPFNLNLVGIRTATNIPNTFNDWMYIFWKYQKEWHSFKTEITTDPGLYWLKTSGNPLGTFILMEGQYRGMWALGKHKGKYDALVQVKPCKGARDFNRDDYLDFKSGRVDEGIFGINQHRSNSVKESVQVDKWSAGCMVTANPYAYNVQIDLYKAARENFGNSFTFTLLNEKDLT